MSHIHEKIDFAVVVYIVHAGKVLLIRHKKLGLWLPVGGHVELDEDPETAVLREAYEESGLEIDLLGTRPPVIATNGRSLIPPIRMDIHRIDAEHQHIGMVYYARSRSSAFKQNKDETDDIRWFASSELDDPALGLLPLIKFYAKEALEICS